MLKQITLMTCVIAAVAAAQADQKEQDRQAILAMAGEFKVKFNFEETLTLGDAEPSETHNSEALEWVKVLADEPGHISLQHILVVEHEGEQHIVKHWRQDWRYEPADMLVFRGHHNWERVALPEDAREGAWTQTVYQVDDAPRYASWGTWRHVGGISFWESMETWRPLPRREHTKRDDYDVLAGENRHMITKDGWVHQQDNYKLALRDGTENVLAWETGFNTYTRTDEGDFAKARAYWEKMAPFWQATRDAWYAALPTEPGTTVHIAEAREKRALMPLILAHADDYMDDMLEGTPGEIVSAEIDKYLSEADLEPAR